ncbi:uncharacterized protein LOC105685638 isoform X2 [Athalia rosae]|uniref:uncharacterized protein LOC105685638 isoform X2 n=1 Tax=Athalia rosae TaxID=37344 RepID=UPI0020342189|nr:uncharacterized protein LOC105685638 isoform X2 [Athalia rosae]
MEQRRPRHKKGNKFDKQKDERSKLPEKSLSNQSEAVKASPSIKKLTPEDYDYVNSDKSQFDHLKRETQVDTSEQVPASSHSRRKVVSNWEKYDDIISTDTETHSKDFQSLLNAPISEGGHFVFKSEKNWTIQATKYSDLFSLNVDKLARDINCIPFNEYIEVEDKYFTIDQLTRFQNLAEKSRSGNEYVDNISKILIESFKEDSAKNQGVESNGELEEFSEVIDTHPDENIEEELEFLLSLKEPINIDQPRNAPAIHQTHTEGKKNPEPIFGTCEVN